jgi:DNA-binding beta-propeller fold protein YncE
VLAALAGCAALESPDPAGRELPVWPAPPDPARFAYEYTLRSAADVALETPEEALRRRLTGAPAPNRPIFEKVGALAAQNGRIYATDTAKRWIVVFDVPRRRLFRFGLRPPGNLAKPLGIALDAASNVYVVDGTRREVIVYDGLGLYLRTIGSAKELERPTGVAVDASGSRIYVIDRATNESDRHRVLVYDREGRRLGEIGGRGSAEGRFNVPVQGAVAPDGTLYVLDAGNFRVQAFDRDGVFLRSFGVVGAGFGQFARPRGIAVDREGNVYVTDAVFGNFQAFSARGELLIAVGRYATSDAPGRYGLISGIAVDETGRVYVADQYFNKIEVIRRVDGTGLADAKPREGTR